jgi:fructose-bisphosphate aldolase/6-deoxy-5-ketofructose 1-phosphate synthase
MNQLTEKDVLIPLTVAREQRAQYVKNYLQATRNSGNFFLFSGDQKIEHLNKDFYGEGIAQANASPQHLFEIASKAPIGAFAAQLGLIAHWGASYPTIPYLIKCNSKTNLVSTKESEPLSSFLHPLDDVIHFAKTSGLNVVGLGYTVYLGSEHEAQMLHEASTLITKAHANGLIVVLWMYPRGKAVKDELDADLIAGAAGVGACLGADFVKINPPRAQSYNESAQLLKQAALAAGRTKLLCSGGMLKNDVEFLSELHTQITQGGSAGNATGRNIHQRELNNALGLCKAIDALVCKGESLEEAKRHLIK